MKSIGTMRLKTRLTDKEVAECRDSLTRLVEEKFEIESEKKEVNAGFRDRLKANEASQQKTVITINERAELREVDIGEVVDGKFVKIIRLDTGEVVSTRRGSQAETDGDETKVGAPILEFIPGGKKDPPAAKAAPKASAPKASAPKQPEATSGRKPAPKKKTKRKTGTGRKPASDAGWDATHDLAMKEED